MRTSSSRLTAFAAALVLATGALGQLSTSAYRVLGQADLRQNGLNMVQGSELYSPGGLALDARDGQLHLYVSDSRNNRVLGWRDARSFQDGGAPELVLGQPSPLHFIAMGIGPKGFTNPMGMAVSPITGDLYVADTGNHRVVRFRSPFANPSIIEPDSVYGQSDFSSRTANSGGISERTMNGPRSLAFDSRGNLWVADTANHRVLRIPADSLDQSTPRADLVIGQVDFANGRANSGSSSVSGFGLNRPVAISFDLRDNLYVSDFNNSRVLKFSAPLVTNQTAATVVGQADFASRTVPDQASASSLEGPAGLAVSAGGALYVAVPGDNRILGFAGASGMGSGGAATYVLGQANFATTLPNINAFPRASASTLSGALDVKIDPDGNLFAADTGNHRVISFAPNATSAARVWGQPDFASNGANQIKPSSINAAYKIAIDYSRSPFALYVSDTNNHRILVWKDAIRFRNGAAADLVIGQPDGATAYPNVDSLAAKKPSQTSLFGPRGIAIDASGTLYVSDSGNHRVLRFQRPVDQVGRIKADAVIGQIDFTSAVSAAVSAASLNRPAGVAIGPNGNLFVSDSGNNRVLEFPSYAGYGAMALRVYGQPDFTTGSLGSSVSAQTLSTPEGIYVNGGAAAVNAAHYLRNIPVAPGSIVTLFGSNLAKDSKGANALPLPRSLDFRELVINDDLRAPLLYLSPGQINFQLPSAAAPGTQRLAVRMSDTGELLAGGSILIAPTAPGLFTLTGDGRGQLAALNEDGTTNGPASPAPRGTVIQMFGTGQGPVSPEPLDGEATPAALVPTVAVPVSDGAACLASQPSVCVAVGNTFGEVLYSGLAPGLVGVWQINVRIPEDVAPGNVSTRVIINAIPSNTGLVAVR